MSTGINTVNLRYSQDAGKLEAGKLLDAKIAL